MEKEARNPLGEREIKTLLTVLGIEDGPRCLTGKIIVDLGCGDRFLKKPIENRGAIYRGLDINECDLETEALPMQDCGSDIAICLALLEHLKDPGHFLTEVKRILKPGGALWLSTPDIEACGPKFWNDPTHVHPYTRSSLRMLLQMSGFLDVLIAPNYRCKKPSLYRDTDFTFFRARYLMPFRGNSRWPVPDIFKGQCTGLFSLARK